MAVSVLVVDDDDEFRSLVVGMLRAAGHDHVHEAATVAGALTYARSTALDVALVDIGLPDGDGIDLARQLSTLHPTSRVLLISADSDAANDAVARGAGAVEFVAKDRMDRAWLQAMGARL